MDEQDTRCDWLLDQSPTVVQQFDVADHTISRGVHTTSLVETGDGDITAYTGPVTEGAIDRWSSSDLEHWLEQETNPVLATESVRWATAVHYDDTVYMAVRERPSGTLATTKDLSRRLYNKLFGRDRRPAMRITLYESQNGQSFQRHGMLVDRTTTGYEVNRNPFLFVDSLTGHPSIVYYCGDGTQYEIRHRTAPTVPGLADTSETVLARSDSLLAAPAMFHHEGQYYLLAEAFDNERDVWITKIFADETIREDFGDETGAVLFAENEACAFPHRIDGSLYITTSRCLGSVSNGGIDTNWEGRIYRFSL